MERGQYSPANVSRSHDFLYSLKYDNIGRNGKERTTFYPRATRPKIEPNPQLIKEKPRKVEFIVYESSGDKITSF